MSAPLLASASSHLASDPSIGGSLFKMFFALVIVCAAIWCCTRVLAKIRGTSPNASLRRAPNGTGLQVLARHTLGKGLQLAVVLWHGRELLVGISGQTITLLKDDSDIARGEQASTPEMPPTASSNDFITRALNQNSTASATPGSGHSVVELLRTFTERR